MAPHRPGVQADFGSKFRRCFQTGQLYPEPGNDVGDIGGAGANLTIGPADVMRVTDQAGSPAPGFYLVEQSQ